MDFWNIAIPALTFLAPAVACLYFTGRTQARSGSEATWGMITFGVVMLVALVGLVRFENPVRLESIWPFSAEPSGYFDFTLQLHWTRYIWIFFTNSLLFVFSAFEGKSSFRGEGRALKFNFLAGASLLSSLAYLSENVLLSLMFLEIMIFLLHAFGIQSSSGEGEQERISFFKRSSFLFLSVLSLLALAVTGKFGANAVVLLGVVLYFLSFIFSRHSFSDWGHQSITLLQAGAAFFLLGRVIGEDLAPGLWVPVAVIFAASGAVFAWFSLTSVSGLGSSFWLLFSMMGYLLYLRFSSGRPEDPFWGAYEAIALGATYSLSSFFRFGRSADQGVKRALYFAVAALLLAIVSGAMPGIDIAGARANLESPVKLITLGLLTFLLSLVVGKSIMISFTDEENKEAVSFSTGLWPAVFLLLIQVGAILRITDLYGEGPFRMGARYLLTNPHIATMGIAVLAGMFAGLLLGANARFVKKIRSNELRMEDLFPSVDPVAVAWNEKTFRYPERGMIWISDRLGHISGRSAAWVQNADKSVFAGKFFRVFRDSSVYASQLTKYFHSGNVRAYLFLGVLLTILASVLFLVEGP
jgi:hypothetical protein